MKRCIGLLACAMGMASQASFAEPPGGPCPISYSRLSMPYNHDRGISTPTVELSFTNETRKKIVHAKFGLIVTGPQGAQVPYDQKLSFSEGADPAKTVSSHWNLEMTKIDIHKMGETIYLQSVRFEDGTTWQDDGNQRCRREEYFGPR